MAGVKQFDEGAVLDEMMKVFWARGYEATSIDELVKATGLKRGSLYNAFGDKDQMFLAAVNRYRDQAERPLLEILADSDPRRALERMFEMQSSQLCDLGQPTGCFLVNASTEVGLRQDAVGRALRDSLAVMESAIHETLVRAQSRGLIAPEKDLRALARFFLATTRSIALMYRSTGDRTFIQDIARCALEVLDSR
jgi:TetR/AcrR family transcriptional repressor of nem operon